MGTPRERAENTEAGVDGNLPDAFNSRMLRHRKLILWIAAGGVVVLVWNWPSKWDRLETWAKERNTAYERRKNLMQALYETSQHFRDNWLSNEMADRDFQNYLESRDSREHGLIVQDLIPLPEVPAWVRDLMKLQETTKPK